ncbi:hypothetical protein DFP73DRAFT_526522 [Morchella snyderi]|nr:hypothetical protein DFP73DRAFT_526522 [Morchella snyderi]
MSEHVGEIRKPPVEVAPEEIKQEVTTDIYPSLSRSEFVLIPSSGIQAGLEVDMTQRVSGLDLITPLPQDGEPDDVSTNGRRNAEDIVSSVTQVLSDALNPLAAQTEVFPTTTEKKVVSAMGGQNNTNKASKTGGSTKRIDDMPREISDRILQEIRRPSDLASLCLTSKKMKSLAAPRLYKNIELRVTQGTMFTPRLLHCLIIPEQRNLVHCRKINVYGEFKREIVEDYERTNSATEHMYGMCLLLRDVLRKIPRDQLQGFLWYPDASPHSMILEQLRIYQTKIEDIRIFMPLYNPDYRTLLNMGDCTALSTLHVGNIRTASHIIQVNKLLEKCSKVNSLRLEIESTVVLQDRQNLLIPDILMLPDTKHKPSYVRLAYFPIAEIPQTLNSYVSLDHLTSLVLISCENDKELLRAIVSSDKKTKLTMFELVTSTPEDIPEFLSGLQATLKHLHVFFKEMDAGFSNEFIDSIISHKSSLETLILDGRFQTTNTAVAPSKDHLRSLKKLDRLEELGFSPEHYGTEAEIRELHALLPPSLRALNCRINFNDDLDLPHWANGYALNFITACIKSYSRLPNTDEWGASFGIGEFDDYPEITSKGFNPKQLEIFALGDGSDTKQMIYTVEIVKDRHNAERPLAVEITRDEVDYVCEKLPQFLHFRHY